MKLRAVAVRNKSLDIMYYRSKMISSVWAFLQFIVKRTLLPVQ